MRYIGRDWVYFLHIVSLGWYIPYHRKGELYSSFRMEMGPNWASVLDLGLPPLALTHPSDFSVTPSARMNNT